MPTINQLPSIDEVSGGNQIPTYYSGGGDARKMSVNLLQDYLQDNLNFPDNASEVTYNPAGTSAVTRTVEAKLRDVVSVKDFGAVGDGTTDDTAAIQAAINSVLPTHAAPTASNHTIAPKVIYLPAGRYLISSPLSLYSFQHLIGEGASTIIAASGGFSGTASVLLKSVQPGSVDICSGAEVKELNFTGSVTAISQATSNILNCVFENLWFYTTKCIALDSYAQACIINNVYSGGSVNQIVLLKGNWNRVSNVDKEGNTGSSSDPYIFIDAHALGDSVGTTFKHILIEGTTHASKVAIKLNATSETSIEDFWFEGNASPGYCFEAVSSDNVSFSGVLHTGTTALGKLKFATNTFGRIQYLNADAEDTAWTNFLDVDTTSYIEVDTVYTRRSADLVRLDKVANLTARSYINRTLFLTPVAGISPIAETRFTSGHNMLVNPSFEAGRYNWTFSTAPTGVEEYITSEVSQGLMGHFTWSAGGSHQFYQSVTVPAAYTNRPMVLTALVKITGSGWISPIAAGLTDTAVFRVTAGTGWQVLTMTAYPTSSGAKIFGVYFLGMSAGAEVYIDEVCVSFGENGQLTPAKFGSFELNAVTIAAATAAPTTGTWKVGDRVINSSPSVGQPKGWACTVAGSPGTWVSEGNL